MAARKDKDANGTAGAARELVITRTLDAPRDHVWRLFIERENAKEWWGPRDFSVAAFEMDLRPGGRWRAVIRTPQGDEYPQYGPECPFTFLERGTKTEMTFRQGPFRSAELLDSEQGGWNECFDRLVAYLERSLVGSAQT